MSIEKNMERIEGKVEKIDLRVDRIAEAFELLARIDERLITMFGNSERMSGDLRTISDRVTELEKNARNVTIWGGIGDKALWIIFGCVMAWAVQRGLH